jgi:acyl-coenzyme A synthetase/AMP-(fatty) acid ligase
MNVVEMLDRAARDASEVPAIIDGPAGRERVTTFAEFEMTSRRIASLLAESGLEPREGVVVMVPMSAMLYAVIAALLRLGLVAVFMDPKADDAQFRYNASRFPIAAFIGTPAACLLRLIRPSLRKIPRVYVAGAYFPGAISLGSARKLEPWRSNHPCADESSAMLAFTSGTTGLPKGMIRSHGLLRATQEALVAELGFARGEVCLATMPIFTLTNLACGATSLIPDLDLRNPGAVDPERLMMQLERWRVQSVVASPSLVRQMTDCCDPADKRLTTLLDFYLGGAPVYPHLLSKLAFQVLMPMKSAGSCCTMLRAEGACQLASLSHRLMSVSCQIDGESRFLHVHGMNSSLA